MLHLPGQSIHLGMTPQDPIDVTRGFAGLTARRGALLFDPALSYIFSTGSNILCLPYFLPLAGSAYALPHPAPRKRKKRVDIGECIKIPVCALYDSAFVTASGS